MGFALGVIFGVILTVALEFGMCWFWREVKKDIRPPYNEPRNSILSHRYDKGYEDGYDACWKATKECHDTYEQIKKEENE